MRDFHFVWGFIAIGVNLLVGAWGVWLWRRHRLPVPKPFWPLVYTGHAAIAVQVAIGLVLNERTPAPGIHVFYGFVLLIAAVLSYAIRSEHARSNVLRFSAVALFIGVVGAARTIPTGLG